MPRLPTLLAGLCAGAFASPWLQDPQKPAPAAKPTPPPATATPDAQDAPGKPARHPIEGVYALRGRVMNGRKDTLPSLGFLAITHRHLFLYLAGQGADPASPLLRAGVRTWKPAEDYVDATIQLGWFTDADGGVHLEKAGTAERRRIELVQGGVRVVQDERNWLEFERVE